MVQIMLFPSGVHCKTCEKLDGKVHKINDALRSLPIPTSCTSASGCRCTYQAL